MKRFISLLVSAVLLLAPTQAADLKISQLSTAGSVASSDEFVINKSGATKKVTLSTIDTSLGVSTHTGNATIHRSINDSTTSATGLWSSSKISTELALKANSTHSHAAGDITSGTLGVSRGGTGLSTIPSNKLLYTSALDTLASLSYDSTLGITAGTIGVQNNTSTQRVVVSKAGTTTGTRRQINLIEGSGISITAADNSGSDRVDVTIATSSSLTPVLNKSANYTAVSGDAAKLLVGTGTWTLSLSPASNLGNGWNLHVRNNGSGNITIDPDGIENINGVISLVAGPGSDFDITCDGSGYFATGRLVFESAQQTPASNTTYTLAHNLGTAPRFIYAYLVCTTADAGYSIGDVIYNPMDGSNAKGIQLYADATNVYGVTSTDAAVLTALHKTSRTATNLTNGSWRIVVRATN